MSGKPRYDWGPVDSALAALPTRPPEGTLKALAYQHHVPYAALMSHIGRLRARGLVHFDLHRAWMPEDDAYLDNHYSRDTVDAIARHLQRSKAAVQRRAMDLGISKYRDGYTAQDVGRALGIRPETVSIWIQCGLLTGRARTKATYPAWYISDSAIHAFLILHPQLWTWARVQDRGWVEAMLTDDDLLRQETPDVRAARLAGGTRFTRPPREHNRVTGTRRAG